jgi:thiol-disulfide isomerase/thioredoxin
LATTNITIGIAFLAGLASFLSPCVLPLVPGYLSLISGVTIDRLRCAPCRAEIPELNGLQHDLEASGLTVVGVSWDDTPDGVRDFQKEIPQNYAVVIGGEDVQEKFAGIRSLPTTYLIDRGGRFCRKIIGARDRAYFEAALKPLLSEDAANAK